VTRTLDAGIDGVVRQGNCSGCGACTQLDAGLAMHLDAEGYSRPTRVGASTAGPDARERFDASCPGVVMRAADPPGSTRHPTMGPVIQAWEAWATDEEMRFTGSSGGTLTALSAWLASTGEASSIVGARAATDEPRRTVSVSIMSREEALASAGSRYGPVSNASHPDALAPGCAVVGKPCEASALRALSGSRNDAPLLLSFFCAGTPSQNATDALVEELGVPAGAPLRSLWYRGHGWPGAFTATPHDGDAVTSSYDDSWGKHLGRAVQWRCRICPDGVGESSDVTAADLWSTDERGYPDFADGAGVSALIARTPRGLDVVQRAIAAGVISATPIDIDRLAAIQPLQRQRRTTLAGRLAGIRLAGGAVPRFPGFGLTRLAVSRWRDTYRAAKSGFRRRREWMSR
jgi:coenzyme F420 hydrogenase subunit beta